MVAAAAAELRRGAESCAELSCAELCYAVPCSACSDLFRVQRLAVVSRGPHGRRDSDAGAGADAGAVGGSNWAAADGGRVGVTG